MNVLFLDYDGVVNNPLWYKKADKWICNYAYPEDNKVNDIQAVQWVSEFCEKYNYFIVISSSWRFEDNYQECLINGGLRENIKILGKTPYLWNKCRGDEIKLWLKEHPEVDNFIILDDESNMGDLVDHLILCKTSTGFREEEFLEAERLHSRFENYKNISG